MKKTVLAALLVAVGACATGPFVSKAQAGTLIPYPNIGVENPETYIFTATDTGPVTAYFAGTHAGFTEVVGMTVNGNPTGITGLNNQTSSIGTSIVLGNVNAGDVLVFFDQVITTGKTWFSNPALNGGDGQHVYSALYDGSHPPFNGTIPAGVYVGFEDLPKNSQSNFDYFDDTFVITNVSATTNETPLPAALPLFATGVSGIGLLGWRRKRNAASLAACSKR
jgi:hypothetical protein